MRMPEYLFAQTLTHADKFQEHDLISREAHEFRVTEILLLTRSKILACQ